MPEEEAFCVFVRLMQEYRLRELFKPSMAELGLCIYQFEYMLQVGTTPCPPKRSGWWEPAGRARGQGQGEVGVRWQLLGEMGSSNGARVQQHRSWGRL